MAKCTDAFSNGWNRMIQLLFQPFRLMFWLKMSFLMLILNAGSVINLAYRLYDRSNVTEIEKYSERITEILPLIIIGLAGLILLMLFFGFLACAARILLYEGVRLGVIYYWDCFKKQSSKIVAFFLWNVIVMLIAAILSILLVGAIVFLVVLLRGSDIESFDPTNHLALVIAAVTLGLGFIIFLLGFFIVYAILLDSFVLPGMLVENRGIFSAWREAIRLALERFWEFLGYSLIRIAVGFVHYGILAMVGIFLGIALFLFGMPLAGAGQLGLGFILIMSVILIPVTFILTLFLLPFPILQDTYTLSFLAVLTGNPNYELFRSLSQEPTLASPKTTAASFSYPSPTGPIHFKEISPEPLESSLKPDESQPESTDPTTAPESPSDTEPPLPPTTNIWK